MSFLDNIISPQTRQTIGATTGKFITDFAGALNPALGRLARSGLIPGGLRPNSDSPSSKIQVLGQQSSGNSQDWKVRISLAETNSIFYQNASQAGILEPLKATRGVIFPYTPNITVIYNASYESQRFTHSNYMHHAYQQSEIQTIQISGEFTAQTQKEADYVLACIYFFRAATKMFFGESENAGNPPPIVFLNGYGEHYFPNVPCVITSFSHTMPDSVDYIETAISFTGEKYTVKQGDDEIEINQQRHTGRAATRIPTASTISVNVQPVYSKSNLAKFNLEQFAAGQLVSRGFM